MENSHDISASTEQRLALHILNNRDAMKKLSSVSKISVLVPEHVETRTLYNQLQPDVSQVSVMCTAHTSNTMFQLLLRFFLD